MVGRKTRDLRPDAVTAQELPGDVILVPADAREHVPKIAAADFKNPAPQNHAAGRKGFPLAERIESAVGIVGMANRVGVVFG